MDEGKNNSDKLIIPQLLVQCSAPSRGHAHTDILMCAVYGFLLPGRNLLDELNYSALYHSLDLGELFGDAGGMITGTREIP